MSDPNILQLLGKIDGKLDQALEAAREHREDDKRRFTEVYMELGKHAEDINKAKGAKGAILWIASALAAAVSAGLGLLAKALGWH